MSQGGGFLALIFLPFLLTSQFDSARRLVLGQGPSPPGEELTTQSAPPYLLQRSSCAGEIGQMYGLRARLGGKNQNRRSKFKPVSGGFREPGS